jgi:hypothetical protein
MKYLNGIFFYGYVLTLIVAGAWGLVAARWDMGALFDLDLKLLPATTAASLLSQYRFLRAIELGFGLFAWCFRDQIYTQRTHNRVFLAGMGAGVLARLFSIALDGNPKLIFHLFLLFELVGIVIIWLRSRKMLQG